MQKLLLLLSFCVLSLSLCAQDVQRIDAMLWDGDFGNALQKIETLIETTTSQSDLFLLNIKKAEALIRSGKFEDAEKLLRSLAQKNTKTKESALIKTNLGFLLLSRGRNDLALESLQEAMDEWEKADYLHTLEAAQTQSHLGNLYLTTGKYSQAEDLLSVALLTRQEILPEKHELIAASLNDLGLLYSFYDNDKALTHYEKALALYEQLHGKSHPKIAIAKANIGYLYTKLELFGDAINNFENALTIWNKVYSGPHPSKGFVLFSLGQTNEKMKNIKAAREYYQQAVTIYEQSYSGKHPDISRVLNALGNIEQSENKFASSLDYYQKAIIANHPEFNSSNLSENPGVRDYYDGNVLLYSLLNKAQVLELNYFRKTLRFKDLLLAIKTLQSCDSLVDHLRKQIRNENDKITLGGIANEVYGDGVRICSEAAQAAWQKKSLNEQAFYFAEKSKAAVLLSAISDANAKSFAGIPASLLEEEKHLKSALALVSQKLAQKPEGAEEQYLRQTFYDLNRTHENFSKRLEKEFPAYYNLKYNSSAPSIRQLQEKVIPGSMLLSYFIDEKNNRLYIFKVFSKGFHIEEKPLSAQFDRSITGLKNSLYFSDLDTYKKAAWELSTVLIPRIPNEINDILIIPNGRLSTIPFETLFTSQPTDEGTYKNLPYLIRKYAVRYEFSSGLILQKSSAKQMDAPSILLCAPVTFNSVEQFSDLPSTESEVTDISALFASRKFASHLLLREKAAEKNIKAEDLKQYSLLHFATHGVVDEKNPELSRIQLNAGVESEDGVLYAGEIYNLELNANLVTLSACQTGLGKISKGEGVIGLSRALVFAGARNCMVSFWKVADESTAQLMKNYYSILLKSPRHNYSATLQRAKLDLISEDRYASPFYWAPFILIGY
jgi:CHAT domain-containing protein/predicted negative regulator of RcsB-dependent stress response